MPKKPDQARRAAANRRPQTVLHIFGGIDQIPVALADWQAHGYEVRHIAPLDMFPGTAHLETLVRLGPAHLPPSVIEWPVRVGGRPPG